MPHGRTLLGLLLPVSALHAQIAVTSDPDLDHVILAVPSLTWGIEEFTRLTGIEPRRGGRHPGRGTENALVSLGAGHYLELLAPVTPAAASAPARMAPMGWALHTRDLPALIERVKAKGFQILGPVPGSRRTPDNTLLQWRTAATGGKGLEAAPFFIEWASGTPHPSTTSPGGCSLAALELTLPDTTRMHDFLITAGFVPTLRTGRSAALRITLECPKGRVTFSP